MPGYECGEDALMSETEQSYLRNFGGGVGGESSGGVRRVVDPAALLSTSPPALASMPVYASNLDQHIDRALLTEEGAAGREEDNYYQPEPTLLNIASGGSPQVRFPQS